MATELADGETPPEHRPAVIATAGLSGDPAIHLPITSIERFDPLYQLLGGVAGLFQQRPHTLDDQREAIDAIVQGLDFGGRRRRKGRSGGCHTGGPRRSPLSEDIAGDEVQCHAEILSKLTSVERADW